jgi:RNA polymerase sigma-70 factor (ECF subfamily)
MAKRRPVRAEASAAPAAVPPLSAESVLAAEIKALAIGGRLDEARERFAGLVDCQQRRAVRIAYHYLRDAYDADEAVQDAFVRVFTHIRSYREHMPFEVWFTRILINGCLDIRKARARRLRWSVPLPTGPDTAPIDPRGPAPTPEDTLAARERARDIAAAVARLPARQRTVFTMCQLGQQSAADVSRALGLSEATVRVHLFRAVHKLRRQLERT